MAAQLGQCQAHAKSLELHTGFPHEWQEPKLLGHLVLFSKCTNGAGAEAGHLGLEPEPLCNPAVQAVAQLAVP